MVISVIRLFRRSVRGMFLYLIQKERLMFLMSILSQATLSNNDSAEIPFLLRWSPDSISVITTDEQMVRHLLSTVNTCLLYTSPSPRDQRGSRMPSSA